jgi:hypothetical protein
MNYNWRPANGTDVQNIVNMAESHFQSEIDNIFVPEPVTYSHNVTLAIVNQFYNPLSTLFCVCYNEDNQLLAYTWAIRGERAPWSSNEMIVVRMAHVNLSLSTKLRIRLVTDMLTMWEQYASYCQVPIICSTTMRKDQHAFLKLHEKHGYDVRGSYAYKKLSTTQATPAN